MKSLEASRLPSHTLLAVVLALGLLIRLGWGLSRPSDDAAIELLPDQRGYLDAGRNLLAGDGLWFVDERFGQKIYAVRTPGYPAFVALCRGSITAVRIAQALIDVSTAFAVFLLARRLLHAGPENSNDRFRRLAASGKTEARRLDPWTRDASTFAPVVAAALVAFNPFLVYFSALLLTETLYTAMLAWAMVLLLRGRAWVGGVLLLALAIHVRPAGVGLPVALAFIATWARTVRLRVPRGEAKGEETRAGEGSKLLDIPPPAGWKGGRWRLLFRATAAATVGLLLTIAVLFPWAWRNNTVLGRWVWSTSNDGITAYDGFHPAATGATDQSFVKQMPWVRDMNELERSDYFAAKAKEAIRDDPARAVRLSVKKIARTWSPVPLSEEFGRPLYKAVALMFALPFDLLVIAGIVAGRMRRSAALFLLVPALYFTAVHAASVGSLRYRVPAEPALAVLAAAGASRLLKVRNEKGG